MSTPRLTTPLALLIAGAMIAVAIFGGLYLFRGDQASSAASASSAPPPGVASPATSTTPTPPRTPPPADTSRDALLKQDVATVAAAARTEIEKHRTAIIDACIKPSLAKKPDPPKVKVTFDLTFSAAGKQLIRSVNEDRETAREGVVNCIADKLPELAVPPMAETVRVDVEWILP